MLWFEDRLRAAALFSLGATLPFLALVFLALLGAFLMVLPVPLVKPVLWLAGAFLLANAGYGFHLALKTFPRQPGRHLRPGEAPVLEERLAAAQAAWKGPRAPEVLLAPDAWGLELTGVPVAGMFGWSRFHWHLGIYPMLALSQREFEAVVGWETVFWSDHHGWFDLQAKRLAAYWYRVHLHLETQARNHPGPLSWLPWCATFLRPYARWVVMAYQSFLARAFLRTDRAIARHHGAPTLVRALCRLAILQPLVTRRVFAQWDADLDRGQPLPGDLYGHLAEVLAQCPENVEGLLDLALDGLLREAPPMLRLRLEYLDSVAQVPMPPTHPAFRFLLGGTAVVNEIHGVWKQRLQATAEAISLRKDMERRRFRELSASLLGRFPDHPEAVEYLTLAFDHAPWDEFDVLLGMFRAVHQGNVAVTFLAIRRALQQGLDFLAVSEARALLRANPLLAPACHEVLAHHLRARGETRNADKEWDRALRAAALAERATRERLGASLLDPLESHGCDHSDLQRIQRVCLAEPRVQEAFLVRKKVLFHAERPVLLLVVRWRGSWWDPFGRKRLAFQQELQKACPFPAQATGFIQVPDKASLWRFGTKLKNTGGLIFSR